jgi:hypothetical protein
MAKKQVEFKVTKAPATLLDESVILRVLHGKRGEPEDVRIMFDRGDDAEKGKLCMLSEERIVFVARPREDGSRIRPRSAPLPTKAQLEKLGLKALGLR